MSVKISSKYQVVIPLEIRESLGLTPGQEVEVIAKGKIAYLVPVQNLKDIQGMLKGKLDSEKLREKKDRF